MNENQTHIREFLMLGFQTSQEISILLFILFLVVYVLTIAENLSIIILVSICKQLGSPMYFFLSNLSVCEILLTSNVIPKMLYLLLTNWKSITVEECFVQFYFFGTAATTECFLLAVMSFDRFLAICVPLHYNAIMDQKMCLYLALNVWAVGLMATVGTIILLGRLQFCGPNVIDHFFCDREPILNLSCSDTLMVRIESLVFSFIITIFPFVVIIWSYTSIILTILKMTTMTGRQKAFSTCSSHLLVVSMYYGTLIMMYIVPSSGQSLNVNKVLSLLYTVVTPFLNPIIYSLRNKDMKGALTHAIQRLSCWAVN
ncbi:olfactory receptor 10A7-like [Discoglossus pictus]